jgi:biofilm PGA synthesis N-glycosyltransferase PgaC
LTGLGQGNEGMFEVLVLIFSSLLLFFLGVYVFYFALLRSYIKRPWGLQIEVGFQPKVSVLIPVHNEESTIAQKLTNVSQILYPKDCLEVIVVDDASEDKTLSVVSDFIKNNQSVDVKVIKQNCHAGKSVALNRALGASSNQIVIVSDADTLWDEDILKKTLPYLADSKVGAITSVGINRNENESWVTEGERTYLGIVSFMRMGESKLHSTIRFEGGFCAYKKEAFDHFDVETGADDSGTALSVVQNGRRAILVPEAVFFTWFPANLAGKLRIKVRRANQLVGLWVKCLKLMLRRRLLLPKRIAFPELLLFTFNPMVFLALCAVGLTAVALYPVSLFSLALVLFVLGSLVFARRVFFEVIVDNLVLVYALFSFASGKRYVSWKNN